MTSRCVLLITMVKSTGCWAAIGPDGPEGVRSRGPGVSLPRDDRREVIRMAGLGLPSLSGNQAMAPSTLSSPAASGTSSLRRDHAFSPSRTVALESHRSLALPKPTVTTLKITGHDPRLGIPPSTSLGTTSRRKPCVLPWPLSPGDHFGLSEEMCSEDLRLRREPRVLGTASLESWREVS